MKKYFIVSDIHSFYKELRFALKNEGFDIKNKEHILVVLGDIFDRGPETVEVYKFIKRVPKYRRILIKGNHEYLYLKLLEKDFPDRYDFSNRTVDTFCHISGIEKELLDEDTYEYDEKNYYKCSRYIWKDIVSKVSASPITKWLKSNEWKDYYELGKYVLVHSFIPHCDDWRNANQKEWELARWGCPWEQYQQGLFKEKDKVLVCGHWHTSDFYKHLDNNNKYEYECAPIYKSKGLIAIDGGVMYNYMWGWIHPQNVLVIDEENIL